MTLRDGSLAEMSCGADEPGARAITLPELGGARVVLPQITLQQLEEARAAVKPGANLKQLEDFKQWTLEHGEQSVV